MIFLKFIEILTSLFPPLQRGEEKGVSNLCVDNKIDFTIYKLKIDKLKYILYSSFIFHGKNIKTLKYSTVSH